MTRYMTDQQLAQLGFGDDLATAAQAVADAEAIYRFVGHHVAATADDLLQFGAAQWGADVAAQRIANALAVLGLQKRLTDVEE